MDRFSKSPEAANLMGVDGVLHRNVQRVRCGLVLKAHRLCVSLISRLESNKEEEEEFIGDFELS